MATSTSGGTTASLSNTPQAKDDYFSAEEDRVYCFDVMANDLGGAAKTLWSIDNTSDDGALDLIDKDVAGCAEYSELGAKISLTTDGKILYDTRSSSAITALDEGETACDQFTYAIRLSNGTLSWATVTVTVTGTNDAPVISVGADDLAAKSLAETDAGLTYSDTLTVIDPDLSDSVTAAVQGVIASGTTTGLVPDNDALKAMLSVTAGSIAADPGSANNLGWTFDSGSEAFNYLGVGDSLTLTYTVRVTDDSGATDDQTVTITITGTNDAPILSDTTDPTAVTELGDASAQNLAAINGSFSVTDLDVGDTLDASVVGSPVVQLDGSDFTLPAGASALIAAGAFTLTDTTSNGGAASIAYSYDPGAADLDFLREGQSLTITYTVKVNDGTADSGEQDVTITITGTNDAPTLTASVTEHTYTDTAADDSFGNVSGTLTTADPDTGDTAIYSVDGGVDDVSRLGFDTSSTKAYGTLYLNSITGAYEFVPNDGAIEALKSDDSTSFTLTVTDGEGATDSETLTINIDGANDTPVAVADTGSAGENETKSFDVLLNDTDRDAGDTKTLDSIGTVMVTSANDTIDGIDASGCFTIDAGQIKFAPGTLFDALDFNDSATVVVNYTMKDADGATSSSTLTLTVNGANDAPTASGTNSVTTDEDNASAATAIGASDIDGDALTYSVKTGGEPAHGSVTFNQLAGTFVYTPDANYNGGDSFTILIDDGHGGTTEQVVSVTVNPVNDDPTASATNSVTTDEDNASAATAIGANDIDGDTLTYSVKSGGEPAHGSVSFNQVAGTFVYTPDANYNGGDSFTILISDGHGGTAEQVVTVTVNPVNDAPTSSNDSNSTNEDVALNGSLPAASDIDGDSITYALDTNAAHGNVIVNADGTFSYTPTGDYNGSDSFKFTVSDGQGGSNTYTYSLTVNAVADIAADSVTVNQDSGANSLNLLSNDSFENAGRSITAVSSASHGTVTINDNGTVGNTADDFVVYTPNAGYSGSDSFTYTVTSGGVTETANVSVNVQNVSPPPTANDDTWYLSNTAIPAGTITASWLLNNDTDSVPGPDFFVSSVSGLPAWLTANFVGGHLTSFNVVGAAVAGDYTFTYTLSDGTSTDTGQVTLHVFDTSNAGGLTSFTLDNNDFSYVDALQGNDTVTGAITLNGHAGNDIFIGGNGDDHLFGGAGNDQLSGGANNDELNGGDGDDFLDGGQNTDTLTGGAGNDMFVLNSTGGTPDTITDYSHVAGNTDTINITALLSVAAGTNVITGQYLRVTTTGLVQIDTNGGGDNWQTVGTVNVSAGLTYNIQYLSGGIATTVTVSQSGPPVALDMDGDGQVSFLATDGGATFDYGGGLVATAWVAGNDGILVRDANHDGQASASEVVFATTGSDLQGLAVYDSNHDGQLSSADEAFGDFRVWQDANSNGVVDSGEMQSLTALGIASISLSSDGVGYSAAGGDVQVVGTGSYTRTDGSTGILADAAFLTGGAVTDEQSKAVAASGSNAALIAAVAAAGLAAAEPLAAATPHSDDGGNARGVDVVAVHTQAFAPVALDSVSNESGGDATVAGFVTEAHSEGPRASAPAHEAEIAHSGIAGDASAPADAPVELLQGSETPVHDIANAAMLTAAGVALPSAEQLGVASAAGDGAGQHNAVVGQVLADALQDGGDGGPTIDALLASVPHADAAEHALAALADAGSFISASAMPHFAVPLEVHMDAAPHA